MPTANDRLADLAIGHQIYLQRYGGGVARKVIALLNRVDADLYRQLAEALERLPPERFTVQRLDQMLVQVQQLNAAAYRAAGEELDASLLELAGYESTWQHQSISRALPKAVAEQLPLSTVTAAQAHAAAMARPFQGKLLREALAGIEQARAIRIRDTIRMGFVEGQTVDQMVRRLRGTRALGYADGLMEIDRRGAEALVRTAVNHTANFSGQAVFDANRDIVKEVVWVSTLDGRTSSVCQARDGQVFPVDKGPRPPAHWNCRSRMAPVLVSAWEALGLSASEIDPGTRSAMDGQLPATTTYQSWLKSKPAEFQDDILGPTKGKLFRDGGMTLDRFVDRSGKPFTIEDLRKRDADAFEKAGILAA